MNKSLLLASAATVVISLTACGDDDNDGPQPGQRDSGTGVVDGKVDAGLDGSLVKPLDSSVEDSAAPADAGSEQNVTLRFKAKVGSEDLVCGKTYANVGTTKVSITPQDFRLFVQEVRLITRAGVEVPMVLSTRDKVQVPQVALLDFTDGTGDCSSGDPGTNTIITGSVPPGDYTGIVFVNGVSEALNHADPTLAPVPLMAPGASWGWLAGYRFLMAEVVAQSEHGDAGSHGEDAGAHGESDAGTSGHGAPKAGLGFVHLGSTACSGTPAAGIACTKPNRSEIRLTGFNPATSTIVADLAAVLSTADLSTQVQCHGSGPACAPMFDALGVNIETGAPQATQRVYRVE